MSELDDLLAEKARRQSAIPPPQSSELDALMAEKARRVSASSSPEAVLRGIGQGATLNFGDEITGAIGAITDPISRGIEKAMYGDNVLLEKGYKDYRNESRAANLAAQKAHPNFYLGGELVGGVAPALMTGGATTAPSIGRLAATGAGWGGASGLGASEEEGIGGMTKDTAIGATLGGALGGGIGALSKFAPVQKAKHLASTIGGFFSDDIAANKANRIIANEIAESGMDSTGARLANREAQRIGAGATLPESLGNERLIRYQHDIAKSGTKGADILANQAEKRATQLVPARVQEVASDIQTTVGPQADAAYSAIRGITVPQQFDEVARKHPLISKAIEAVQDNPIYRSEPMAPNTIGFYDLVKDELDDMASKAVRAGENNKARIIGNVKSQMLLNLDDAAPDYAVARRLAQRNIGGKEIQDALENTKIGSISGLKNTLFGTPAKQADILRKLEPHEQKALEDIMGELEKMERSGLTGALGSSGRALREEIAPKGARVITGATSATMQMFNWVANKIHEKNYKALADAFVSPDMSAIAQQMAKTKNIAAKKALIDDFATKFLSSQGSREVAEPTRTKITITPPTEGTPNEIPPTPDSDTIPPAIEPALDTVGGGAGDDTLNPSFGGLRSMMPTKKSVMLKSSYKPRKERITITPSSSVPNDIIREEGTRLSAYKDTKGYTTVGTGFNMDSPNARKVWQEAGLKTPFQAVKRGRLAITPTEAKQLAAKSYEIALNDAKRIYPNFGKLSKNRQRALANISYQMGLSTLSEFKDANNAIRNGKFNAAVRHFARSAWAKKQTPERAKRILAMLEKDVPYEES